MSTTSTWLTSTRSGGNYAKQIDEATSYLGLGDRSSSYSAGRSLRAQCSIPVGPAAGHFPRSPHRSSHLLAWYAERDSGRAIAGFHRVPYSMVGRGVSRPEALSLHSLSRPRVTGSRPRVGLCYAGLWRLYPATNWVGSK